MVTGAGGALGRAVVSEFAANGFRVIAVARSVEDVASLVDAHPDAVAAEAADLTDPGQVAALWRRLDERGAVPSFLVNTAGGYRGGTLAETGVEDYRDVFGVNLDTAWWSCREAARRMAEIGGGAIVNVASRTALRGGAGAIGYAVAKAAVIKLSQVLADELKDADVRVNAVLPAVIDTPANAAVMSAARMAKAVPAESIAKVIAFLCSPDAWPISGAVIPTYGRY